MLALLSSPKKATLELLFPTAMIITNGFSIHTHRIFLLLVLLITCNSLPAQWIQCPTLNKELISPGSEKSQLEIVTNSTDNIYAKWLEHRNDSSHIYIQRFDPEGRQKLQEDGMLFTAFYHTYTFTKIFDDGQGGIIVIWKNDQRLFSQRIDSSGNSLWTQPVELFAQSTFYIEWDGVKILQDSNYNMIITTLSHTYYQRTIKIQKLTPSGTLLWSDSTNLYDLYNDEYIRYSITLDPSGDTWIAWQKDKCPACHSNRSEINIQRITSNGNLMWPPNGKVIGDAGYQSNLIIHPDHKGGSYIYWMNNNVPQSKSYYQRVDSSGNEYFAHNGIQNPSLFIHPNQILSDESGMFLIRNSGLIDKVDFDGNSIWPNIKGIATSSHYDPLYVLNGKGGITAFSKGGFYGNEGLFFHGIDSSGNYYCSDSTPTTISYNYSSFIPENLNFARIDSGKNFVFVWTQFRSGGEAVYGQKLSGECGFIGRTLGGTISADSTLIHQFSSTNLYATGYYGDIQWQRSLDSILFFDSYDADSIYQTYPRTEDNYYRAIFYSHNSCYDTSNVLKITIIPSTGVNDLNSFDPILFPNPVNDYITIRSIAKDIDVKIYSIEGMLLSSFNYPGYNGPFTKQIDIRHLSPGCYLMEVNSSDHHRIINRFVKL